MGTDEDEESESEPSESETSGLDSQARASRDVDVDADFEYVRQLHSVYAILIFVADALFEIFEQRTISQARDYYSESGIFGLKIKTPYSGMIYERLLVSGRGRESRYFFFCCILLHVKLDNHAART